MMRNSYIMQIAWPQKASVWVSSYVSAVGIGSGAGADDEDGYEMMMMMILLLASRQAILMAFKSLGGDPAFAATHWAAGSASTSR